MPISSLSETLDRLRSEGALVSLIVPGEPVVGATWDFRLLTDGRFRFVPDSLGQGDRSSFTSFGPLVADGAFLSDGESMVVSSLEDGLDGDHEAAEALRQRREERLRQMGPAELEADQQFRRAELGLATAAT